jgi:hypothetical protein
MDISKLPKLSQSEPPPPSPVEPADHRPIQFAPPNRVAEVWISIAIGIILLLVTPHTLGYFSSRVFHTPFAPFADPTRPYPARCDFILYDDGTKIFYRDTRDFWNDLVITAFAMVLIVDGILMVRARRAAVVMAGLLLTILATLGDLIYLVATFSSGVAIISALAVVFGVYIAISQWSVFRMLSTNNK